MMQNNIRTINNNLQLVENTIFNLERAIDNAQFSNALKENNKLMRDLRDQVDMDALIEAKEIREELDMNN